MSTDSFVNLNRFLFRPKHVVEIVNTIANTSEHLRNLTSDIKSNNDDIAESKFTFVCFAYFLKIEQTPSRRPNNSGSQAYRRVSNYQYVTQ